MFLSAAAARRGGDGCVCGSDTTKGRHCNGRTGGSDGGDGDGDGDGGAKPRTTPKQEDGVVMVDHA